MKDEGVCTSLHRSYFEDDEAYQTIAQDPNNANDVLVDTQKKIFLHVLGADFELSAAVAYGAIYVRCSRSRFFINRNQRIVIYDVCLSWRIHKLKKMVDYIYNAMLRGL